MVAEICYDNRGFLPFVTQVIRVDIRIFRCAVSQNDGVF